MTYEMTKKVLIQELLQTIASVQTMDPLKPSVGMTKTLLELQYGIITKKKPIFFLIFLFKAKPKAIFLVADTQLYKRLCPSVGRLVGPLVSTSRKV